MAVEATTSSSSPLLHDYVFEFEKQFNYQQAEEWMRKHWKQSIYWSMAYLTFIFVGSWLMESLKLRPFQLRKPLIIWNLTLAIFSIIGTWRCWPEMIHVLRNHGFHHSVCDDSFHTKIPVTSFWSFLFVLSKVPELLDTVFVVLRKQKLIFLHWYHHSTVLIYSWFLYADMPSVARWYICMNFAVHAWMYSYYAARAAGFRVPKPLAMLITIAQILQMIMGTFVTFYAVYVNKLSTNHYHQRYPCKISSRIMLFGVIIYSSYLVLFAIFFIKSYFGKPSSQKNTKSD